MNGKSRKPKKTAHELIVKMRDEKGITFRYISEQDAEIYLNDINNFFRTASYRQNYQKYLNGENNGKYIDLDFAYLRELSVLDSYFRMISILMCIDIEHALQQKLLRDIANDHTTDGYDIVHSFISHNLYIISLLEAKSTAPFNGDLIQKYFMIKQFHHEQRKVENKIIGYDDCPAWVFVELLTFGDLIKFQEFYYASRGQKGYPCSVLNLIRSLRNGAAHNSCLLANMGHKVSGIPPVISTMVSSIPNISASQRKKRLSGRPMLEFAGMLYIYHLLVTENVKMYRVADLKRLFWGRMPEKKIFFKNNDLIKSNYFFACKLITHLFP